MATRVGIYRWVLLILYLDNCSHVGSALRSSVGDIYGDAMTKEMMG